MHPDPAQADPLFDPLATSSERTYCLIMHLSLLAAHVFIPVVPALVMWLIKRNESPFINDHGREAVNFQISVLIYVIAAGAIGVVTCIGAPLIAVAYVLGIVGMILAASAAHNGRYFRYPACIRFIT